MYCSQSDAATKLARYMNPANKTRLVCLQCNTHHPGGASPPSPPARFARCHLPISRLCSGFFNRKSAKPLLVLIGSSRYGALAAKMSNRHQPICEPVKTLIPIKSRRAKRENDNLPISDTLKKSLPIALALHRLHQVSAVIQ